MSARCDRHMSRGYWARTRPVSPAARRGSESGAVKNFSGYDDQPEYVGGPA